VFVCERGSEQASLRVIVEFCAHPSIFLLPIPSPLLASSIGALGNGARSTRRQEG
jgi:hypothetical protein